MGAARCGGSRRASADGQTHLEQAYLRLPIPSSRCGAFLFLSLLVCPVPSQSPTCFRNPLVILCHFPDGHKRILQTSSLHDGGYGKSTLLPTFNFSHLPLLAVSAPSISCFFGSCRPGADIHGPKARTSRPTGARSCQSKLSRSPNEWPLPVSAVSQTRRHRTWKLWRPLFNPQRQPTRPGLSTPVPLDTCGRCRLIGIWR